MNTAPSPRWAPGRTDDRRGPVRRLHGICGSAHQSGVEDALRQFFGKSVQRCRGGHADADRQDDAVRDGVHGDEARWAWKIPLTQRFGNGYVYSSKFCSADQAETELRERLGLLDSDTPARHLKMKIGRVTRHWNKNCLAVGLSQGFIEPLEATALLFIQQTAAVFVDSCSRGT